MKGYLALQNRLWQNSLMLKNGSVRVACFIFPLFVSAHALAQETESPVQSPDLSGALLQVGFALGFIILLILGFAWLAKRFNLNGRITGQQIKALSVLPLGRKEKVILIESCGTRMLIGVSSSAINVLHVFDQQHSNQDISDAAEADINFSADKSNESLDSSSNLEDETAGVAGSKEFSSFLKTIMSGNKHER